MLKWIASGILLFLLFHFESVSLGPIKVSHLWKGMLLGFLIIKVAPRGRIRPSIYKPLLFLSVLIFFSLEVIYNPINAVFTFSTTIILPLIGVYALKKDAASCKKALYFFSAFFILSFIPYEIGLLTPLGKSYDLTHSYGFEFQGSIGPFQNVHSASTALAGALLVILYFFIVSAFNRAWLVLLLSIGFYFLFDTLVRTGMLMFAAGSLVMLWSIAVTSNKRIIQIALLSLATLPLASAWLLSNDALMARIVGERANSSELDSFESMGSGRVGMALVALDIYAEANFYEKLLGMGITQQKKRMGEKRGIENISHNGFLDVLLHQGIVGFVLLTWFFGALWRGSGRLANSLDTAFVRSLSISFFIMTFFQEFDMLYMPLLMMIAYAWKKNSIGFKSAV